jgi:hypothetical protein
MRRFQSSEDGTLSTADGVADREARVIRRSATPSGGIFNFESIDRRGGISVKNMTSPTRFRHEAKRFMSRWTR